MSRNNSAKVSSGVLLTQDNQSIAYSHYNAGHSKAVIIAHGFYNSRKALLLLSLKDALIDLYDVVMFDFRGHGESSGLFTWTSKEHYDLRAVLDYARKQYTHLGLVGFSFGAAVGMQVLAHNKDVASFVSVSAPSECEKIEFHFWGINFENDIFYNLGQGRIGKGVRPGPFWLPKIKPINCASSLTVPVLYVHGEKDWVTSWHHSDRLYEATSARKKLVIVPDGLHAEYLLRRKTEELIRETRCWLLDTLGPSGT